MLTPVIYVNVDIVFLMNFLTDLAWLWLTASLAGIRSRWWRLSAAAAVGALAAVWAYFDSGQWLLSLTGSVVGTAALLAIAFLPCRPPQALRLAAYLVFSGGSMAGITLLASRDEERLLGGVVAVPSTLVVAGLLLTLLGVRYLWEAARERRRLAKGLYHLRVRLGEQAIELPALLDTGNSLKDPLGGAPVVVVEAAALQGLIPPALLGAASAGWTGLDGVPGSWASRCRLVPFRAVGRPAGVLLALTPDELAVQLPGRSDWQPGQGMVGLAADRLHPDGAYRALLSPDTLVTASSERGLTWEGETG